MKKIIILLITISILTSCYSNPEDTKKIKELENKISKLEKQLEENNLKEKEFIFKKQKECNNLIKENENKKFYFIKYSKELNSCIGLYGDDNLYKIQNLYTGEDIFKCDRRILNNNNNKSEWKSCKPNPFYHFNNFN